jgi:predicted nucleic acid-binding protein
MISHVVDASMFGPLFFEDEADELFEDLPELISGEHCIVPQHWHLEVTNQILSGLRRKRMTSKMAEQAVAQIDLFPITTDDKTAQRIAESYSLASKHGLTVYDAAYLELAIRRHMTIVTYDNALRKAALAENIALLPE